MEEDLYKEIVHFHSVPEGKYPSYINTLMPTERNNHKSNFRQKAKNYQLTDGVLTYEGVQVLVRSSVDSVLSSFHVNPATGNHIGRDSMHSSIKKLYYWRGMKAEISEYIQSCPKCIAKFKKEENTLPSCSPITSVKEIKIKKEKNTLPSSSPILTKVWNLVKIDIIGPLQMSTNGNEYIVVATDQFSKYTEAAAIRDKTPEFVGDFLFNIIFTFGCMDSIFTKQGKEYTESIINVVLKRVNLENNIKAVDTHELNAPYDIDNESLIKALSSLEKMHGCDWEKYIRCVLFTYHTSVHAFTKCTPYKLMFGREMKLPTIKTEFVHITDDVKVEVKERINESELWLWNSYS